MSTNDCTTPRSPEPFFGRRCADHDRIKDLPPLPVLNFAERVQEIARGARLVGELLEAEAFGDLARSVADDPDDEVQPLLSPDDRETLSRFMTRSLELLHRDSEELVRWANAHYRRD